MRKLFVSIRGAMGALMRGHVTAADLADGLFFLCGTGPETFEDPDYPEHPVKQQLADAMQKAEAEGRGLWSMGRSAAREGYNYNEYRILNGLLTANGYQAIDESPAAERNYRQVAVEERLRGQDLEVITSRWWMPPGGPADSSGNTRHGDDTFAG